MTIKLWDARDVVRKLEIGRAAVVSVMEKIVQDNKELYDI